MRIHQEGENLNTKLGLGNNSPNSTPPAHTPQTRVTSQWSQTKCNYLKATSIPPSFTLIHPKQLQLQRARESAGLPEKIYRLVRTPDAQFSPIIPPCVRPRSLHVCTSRDSHDADATKGEENAPERTSSKTGLPTGEAAKALMSWRCDGTPPEAEKRPGIRRSGRGRAQMTEHRRSERLMTEP
ncbi:unnamed protein product [Phyllotreta striolata]|uniref:Uncharacterized protein n=1 Tax=Phyllotreta striolata TaxID=444603 RepID=A0A9N9TFP7_PHYSR|nr:unnamed protein product [Phyllotreta striolata]